MGTAVSKWLLMVLCVVTLITLVYFAYLLNKGQRKYDCIQILPPQTTMLTDSIESSWIDYEKNWNEEILITNNPTERVIVFTKEYQLKMKSKGPHPLSVKHERFYKRAEMMDKYCSVFPSKGNYWYGEGLRSVLFNDETKLLLCTVPKIGSTTWSYIFMKMLDPSYNFSLISTRYPKFEGISLKFSGTDEKMNAKRYQTYTKFLVTRNPFERLLSAYTDKFTKNNTYYEPQFAQKIIITNYLSDVNKEIIKSTREKMREGKDNLITGLDDNVIQQIGRLNAGLGNYKITFLEFLNYVIKAAAASGLGALDKHWCPVTTVCNPCIIGYDIIIKFETLHEDSKVILDYVQTNTTHEKVEFPIAEHAIKNNTCNEAFMEIPMDVRNKIYELFQEDYILFGYKYNGNRTDNILC